MSSAAAFYDARQRLDMAKKHDILKQKMQRRPDREELVRQHILEGTQGQGAGCGLMREKVMVHSIILYFEIFYVY